MNLLQKLWMVCLAVFFVGQLSAQESQQDSTLLKYAAKTSVNRPDSVHNMQMDELSQRISAANQDNIMDGIDRYYKSRFLHSPEFITCLLLLLFAVLLCAAEVYLFIKGGLSSFQIIKLLILTLIIFAVLFLIAAGYSNEQISPAFGLLGTIAGYLLGKASPESTSPSSSPFNTTKDNEK